MKYTNNFFNEAMYPNFSINGRIYDNRNKKDLVLVVTEPHNIKPQFYNIDEIKKYKGMITWNDKFYNKNKNSINIKLYRGGQPIYQVCKLDEPTKFSNKINGICSIGKSKKRKSAGDITHKRLEVMRNIEDSGKLITHYYGWKKWGGNNYIGQIGNRNITNGHIKGNGYHCSLEKIRVISKYKFYLCFENCYHKFWSWGYITEKIMCCFEARTIPIYFGCFNVEQLLPSDIYIDFRKFCNCNDLIKYLCNISEDEYNRMVDKAYDFKMNTKINDVDELVKLFREM